MSIRDHDFHECVLLIIVGFQDFGTRDSQGGEGDKHILVVNACFFYVMFGVMNVLVVDC